MFYLDRSQFTPKIVILNPSGYWTITIARALAPAEPDVAKEVVFKNYAPFTTCISEIKSKEIDNARGIDVVMVMYNLIEYSNNYSKTSGSLWQY